MKNFLKNKLFMRGLLGLAIAVVAVGGMLTSVPQARAAAVITLTDNTINEAAESSGVITVTLAGDTFVETLTPGNWAVTNLPTGVTKGTVTRTDETTATIALVGNRTVDYDTNITDVTVTVQAAELTSSAVSASASTGVTLVASADAETIGVVFVGDGAEATMNTESLTVTLTGGTLISDQVNDTNITATGTAVSAAGVTIEAAGVSYRCHKF